MSLLKAAVLGFVQGISEFLPISSSGHLQLAGYFMDVEGVPLLFSLLLHLATLAAVCLVFRERIASLFAVLFRIIIGKSTPADASDKKIIFALFIGTIMTGLIGLLLKDFVESIDVRVIAACLIVTGIVLILAEKASKKEYSSDISLKQGGVIGLLQGVAVMPGISRSGITISGALLLGLSREEAGEFSFLLSIPAILAAFMLELKSADTLNTAIPLSSLIAGVVVAFASGYVSLKLLLSLVKRGRLSIFAYYLIPIGLGLLVYFLVL